MPLFHALLELPRQLLEWTQSFASSPAGVWALFLFAFAESSFFPIPPDVLLIALCISDPGSAMWFALVCSIGSVLGGIAGYGIGFYGGRPLLYKLFREERILAVKRYYDRYNAWAVFIAGLTPLPYKLFTLSGGAFTIKFRVFVWASVLSRSLRFFAVAALIQLFGESILVFIQKYLNLLTVAFVVLLLAGYWLLGKWGKRVTSLPATAEREPAE
jgi:membrane protein YqaA with SNARE-associated domain